MHIPVWKQNFNIKLKTNFEFFEQFGFCSEFITAIAYIVNRTILNVIPTDTTNFISVNYLFLFLEFMEPLVITINIIHYLLRKVYRVLMCTVIMQCTL